MRILFAGFKGMNNSSKLLLDALSCDETDKLYLTNSYKTSERQLIERLETGKYGRIVIFGQWKRVPKGNLRLETVAKKGRYKHLTNFPCQRLAQNLRKLGYNVQISDFAGRWLCNNIYFYGLKYLEQTGQKCQMVFIHLPKMKNIEDFEKLGEDLEKALQEIKKVTSP